MGKTVGDVIFEIEKYEKLKERISVSVEERISNQFKSNDDVVTFIKSKVTYNDLIELQLLIADQIDMLKNIKVVEDEDDD